MEEERRAGTVLFRLSLIMDAVHTVPETNLITFLSILVLGRNRG